MIEFLGLAILQLLSNFTYKHIEYNTVFIKCWTQLEAKLYSTSVLQLYTLVGTDTIDAGCREHMDKKSDKCHKLDDNQQI